MNLASLRIITRDVDRLVRFYETVGNVSADRPAPVFAEFRTATGTLAVADHTTVAMLGENAPESASNRSVIIEFLVTDVDAEFDRIHHVLDDVVLVPTTMPWGNRSAMFRDPDGNLVNIFSRPGVG